MIDTTPHFSRYGGMVLDGQDCPIWKPALEIDGKPVYGGGIEEALSTVPEGMTPGPWYPYGEGLKWYIGWDTAAYPRPDYKVPGQIKKYIGPVTGKGTNYYDRAWEECLRRNKRFWYLRDWYRGDWDKVHHGHLDRPYLVLNMYNHTAVVLYSRNPITPFMHSAINSGLNNNWAVVLAPGAWYGDRVQAILNDNGFTMVRWL